jgi:hypothetical protein
MPPRVIAARDAATRSPTAPLCSAGGGVAVPAQTPAGSHAAWPLNQPPGMGITPPAAEAPRCHSRAMGYPVGSGRHEAARILLREFAWAKRDASGANSGASRASALSECVGGGLPNRSRLVYSASSSGTARRARAASVRSTTPRFVASRNQASISSAVNSYRCSSDHATSCSTVAAPSSSSAERRSPSNPLSVRRHAEGADRERAPRAPGRPPASFRTPCRACLWHDSCPPVRLLADQASC